MFSFIRRHKIISGLVCANLITIIAVAIVIIIHQHQTATIDINVTPSAATITLNGRQYDNFQSYDILPGNYRVKIAMDGMQTKEYDLTLEKDGFARIWDYLIDADGSFTYYLSHPDDFTLLTEIANKDDVAAQNFITEYNTKAGIIDLLPIEYDAYTDDFAYYTQYHIVWDFSRESCPKIACLVIEDNTGGNEQAALNKIKELGYNPDDYEITYQYVPLYTSGMNNE